MVFYFLLPLLFVISASSITALTKSLQLLGRIQTKREFMQRPNFYAYFTLVRKCFGKNLWDSLFYILSFTKHLLRLLFATTLFFFLIPFMKGAGFVILAIAIVAAVGLLFELLFRTLAGLSPASSLKAAAPFTSFFVLLCSPITFSCLYLQLHLFPRSAPQQKQTKIKNTILEFVQETELSTLLDPMEKRLITSIASFPDRISREIMVPRIDIVTLSIDQTLHQATREFLDEGYSRIPIYRDTVDNIIGVLHHKDLMAAYYHHLETGKDSPAEIEIESLLKPVLYAPETKRITNLLQEFRKKQIHMAIVVDEYGGTEGIVTIEDILEELVGEIADEFDVAEEEQLYVPFPGGGWVVDGKMTIIDIEKELSISIPMSPEYDTIGGYIFERLGTIPSKGARIHHDNFDLEVLSSSDRAIEKVIITPILD